MEPEVGITQDKGREEVNKVPEDGNNFCCKFFYWFPEDKKTQD